MPSSSSVKNALVLIEKDKSRVLGISFRTSIQPGEYLARADAQSLPAISYSVPSTTGSYMLVVLDLDAPFPSLDVLGPILHAIQPGYKPDPTDASRLTATQPFVANYIGPAPPPGSSPHRYALFLYEQPADFGGVKFAPEGGKPLSNWHRMRFDLDAWEKKSKMGKPVAANYFRSN